MPEFIVTILVVWFDGPLIIEIVAPSCDAAVQDIATTMGYSFTKILSCIEMIGV